jgi:ankyrin repeat protein
VLELWEHGARPGPREVNSHDAAGLGKERFVRLLIENGADVNETVPVRTPLHFAVEICANDAVI